MNLYLFTKPSSCNNEISIVSAPVAAFYLFPSWSDLLILDCSLDKSSSNDTSYNVETEDSVQELLTAICSTFLCTLGLHSEENKHGSRKVGGESLHLFNWTRWRSRLLQFESLLWTVELTTYHFNIKFQYKTRAEKVWSLRVWKENHHGKFRNLNFASIKQFLYHYKNTELRTSIINTSVLWRSQMTATKSGLGIENRHLETEIWGVCLIKVGSKPGIS